MPPADDVDDDAVDAVAMVTGLRRQLPRAAADR